MERFHAAALPIYARLLADSLGVELRFGAKRPETNGRIIWLDTVPSDSPEAIAMAFGKVMHEAGHVTETTFDDVLDKRDPQHKIQNILEDVRMEGCQIARYPGARRRLDAMVEGLIKTGYFAQPHSNISPNAALTGFMGYRLRASVLGQPCEAYAEQAEAIAREKLPETTVDRLLTMMFAVADAQSTADTVVLTERIFEMLEEESQEPPDPDDGNPDDGSPDDGSPDDGNPDDGNPDDGSPDDGSPDDGNPDDGQQKREHLRRILSGDDDDGVGDLDEVLEEAIGQLAAASQDQAVRLPASMNCPPRTDSGAPLLDSVATATRALSRRLVNLFEAAAEIDHSIGRTGRKLATNRLYRIPAGNPHVFKRVQETSDEDTAVLILFDKSPSMTQRLELTTQSALAIRTSVEHLYGVDAAVAAFPHEVDGDPHGVLVLTDYGDPVRNVANRFQGIRACGSTPLSEALMWAGYNLMASKRSRRMLMVLTDGQPNNPATADQMVGMLEAEGIEVMGVGIGVDVSARFRVHTRIDSIDSLAGAMFALLQKQLIGARRAA